MLIWGYYSVGGEIHKDIIDTRCSKYKIALNINNHRRIMRYKNVQLIVKKKLVLIKNCSRHTLYIGADYFCGSKKISANKTVAIKTYERGKITISVNEVSTDIRRFYILNRLWK